MGVRKLAIYFQYDICYFLNQLFITEEEAMLVLIINAFGMVRFRGLRYDVSVQDSLIDKFY